ncbi:MAG: dependent protein [Thermoanaerobacteraceae bacterium]|nr:dependent protein [Thermoanaerobacteraceae bacterium]MDN5300554.1 dependent protein [Thermoanaerobacteraceae bacterium]
METLEQNIAIVKSKIGEAAAKSGRSPEEIHLVAVTKTVPPETVQKAVNLGITLLGENRVQEAGKKVDIVRGNVQWHLIGHLQKNKVKPAIKLFSMIQSLDSLGLAEEIEKRAGEIRRVMDVLIQINIGREETKAGIDADDAVEFIKKVSQLPHIKIKGLMAIPPFKEDPEEVRYYFRKMNDIFQNIKMMQIENVEMNFLSMGMTHDFGIAIEEGSNMVRIGTGIFGKRK